MDILSNHLVSLVTALISLSAFGAALLYKNKTLSLCGLWFVSELACDGLTTGFSEYATATQYVSYLYLYAITSILFSFYVIKNNKSFSKSLLSIFLSICILSVIVGAYHWFVQSNWSDWGCDHYYAYGETIDGTYFTIIVALEALMILLGVYSAMASIRSTNGVRIKRR